MIPFGKMAKADHLQSWSDLPTELAGLVLCRLPAYSDRVRFGCVCRNWSFSLSSTQHCLPKPLPCLAFPDGTFFCLPHRESYQFPSTVSYHSSCGEWLVFLHDGNCFVKNPFSKITLTLPNLSSLCPIDEPVEIINGRVNPEDEMPQEPLNMDAGMAIDKVIVCSELLIAAIVDIGPLKTVALCRPGAESWLVSRLGSKGIIIEMMLSEGKLYALNQSKDLLVIIVGDNDNGKLNISRIERLIENRSFGYRFIRYGVSLIDHFLVECNGALLLLSRTIFGKLSDGGCGLTEPVGVKFDVFKADFHLSRWEDVTSVGDEWALFVSKSHSRSVSVSQYNKLKGNCISFLDDGRDWAMTSVDDEGWFWKSQASSYIVYDMSDGETYSPIPDGSFKGKKAPATWLFPH
ncbi:hypothetical protein EJB05_50016 [Eragrostis curvula]|uniref:F-box domain-containing protein n=1 Tax=Eragrostis curvula TaxID=38414 RepID=A0A5J9SZH0_9POAL|nr:hypothetical protein EJB05_50016 [Eragrostis curvula]